MCESSFVGSTTIRVFRLENRREPQDDPGFVPRPGSEAELAVGVEGALHPCAEPDGQFRAWGEQSAGSGEPTATPILEPETDAGSEPHGPGLHQAQAVVNPGADDSLPPPLLERNPRAATHVGLGLVEDFARDLRPPQGGTVAIDRARGSDAPRAYRLRRSPSLRLRRALGL